MRQLVSRALVAREREVAALEGFLASPEPPTLLVSGEAGVGKSRLIGEARERATDLGLQVLQGRCFEPDRTLPFAPLLDVLRPLLGWHTLTSRLVELSYLLPELGTGEPTVDGSPPIEPAQRRRRAFSALADLLVGLAGSNGLALVVEDLHWSDEASLDFLAYFAHHLAHRSELATAHGSLCLLLSYRSDEVGPSLGHFLAELDRGRLAREIQLAPLSPDHLATLVRSILELDRPAPADLVETLYRLTEGNPFFVEEILKSLVVLGDLSRADGGWTLKPLRALRIPRTVHDAVQRRTAVLSESARRLLVLAAVAGRRFDFALLQEVSRQDEAELLALVKELVGQQLVVEESPDRFAFRHALTREAIYADLLSREARGIHRAVVEAAEQLYAGSLESRSSDLAYHAHAAGDWARVLRYSDLAGRQALAVYSPRAAIEHLTRAIEASDSLGQPPSAAFYQLRARAHDILGDFEAARSDHELALERARAGGNALAEWQALLDLGLLWSARDYSRTRAYVEQALDQARRLGDQRATAATLNRLGNLHVNVGRPGDALRHHRLALGLFESLDDRRGIAETLDLLGMASLIRGDLVGAAGYYDRAIPLLTELDDRERLVTALTMWVLASGYYFTSTAVSAALDLAKANERGESALAIARESGWRTGEAFVLYELAIWLGPLGEYGRAFEAARSALAIAESTEHRQWVVGALTALGALHLDVLDLATARQYLDRALEISHEIGSSVWIEIAGALLGSTYTQQRDFARASTVLEQALAGKLRDPRLETIGERLCWAARAELLLTKGDPGAALEAVDRLIETAIGPAGKVVPRLCRLRGEALFALGRSSEARIALQEARKEAIARGLGPELWRVDVALGRLHRRRREHAESRAAFAEARTLIGKLATAIFDAPVANQFRERALASLPPVRPLTRRQALRDAYGGLTARERDVATRVARGLSNRAIADELVVSERTVETYVSSILDKLGFESRARIAAWAVSVGLLSRES